MSSVTEQWEYKTVFDPTDTELNVMGKEGWQLISVVANAEDDHIAYMMRAIKTVILPRTAQPMNYPWHEARVKASDSNN